MISLDFLKRVQIVFLMLYFYSAVHISHWAFYSLALATLSFLYCFASVPYYFLKNRWLSFLASVQSIFLIVWSVVGSSRAWKVILALCLFVALNQWLITRILTNASENALEEEYQKVERFTSRIDQLPCVQLLDRLSFLLLVVLFSIGDGSIQVLYGGLLMKLAIDLWGRWLLWKASEKKMKRYLIQLLLADMIVYCLLFASLLFNWKRHFLVCCSSFLVL